MMTVPSNPPSTSTSTAMTMTTFLSLQGGGGRQQQQQQQQQQLRQLHQQAMKIPLNQKQILRILMIVMVIVLCIYMKLALTISTTISNNGHLNNNNDISRNLLKNKKKMALKTSNIAAIPISKSQQPTEINAADAVITKNTTNNNDQGYENDITINISNAINHDNDNHNDNDNTNNNNTTIPCFMSKECIQKVAQSIARAFPDRSKDRKWIVPPDSDPNEVYDYNNNNSDSNNNSTSNNIYTNAGILYVKNFKAASTTIAGAAFRMAYHVSENLSSFTTTTTTTTDGNNNNTSMSSSSSSSSLFNYYSPPIRKDSKPAWVKAHHTRGNHYKDRYKSKSFLFTSVREPAARAMSRIFYTSITEKGEMPTDENVLSKLKWNQIQYGAVSHVGGGYQVRYVSMNKTLPTSWDPQLSNQVVNPQFVHETVANIFQDYDFILLAERLDESLVAMALLLGISIQDVLVQSAKVGTSTKYLYFTTKKRGVTKETCRPYISTFVSPVVQDHLHSTEWYAKNYGDYLLHATANISLDKTIDETIGRLKFQLALNEFRQLSQMAKMKCSNQTIYHCSSNGTIQRHLSKPNCYEDDSGCGYPCIDQMLFVLEEEKQKNIETK